MAKIFMNLKGSLTSGGPTVAAARLAKGFTQFGHKVVYNDFKGTDWALCIIESGKVLRKRKNKNPKVAVRLDGFYMRDYWHNKTPDRQWRPDMDALHNAIKRDVAQAELMVYQSSFSKKMIDLELAKRDRDFVIINNGVDTKRFKPKVSKKTKDDTTIRLFHHGIIRNDYIIEGLLEVYEELKARGHEVEITIVGSMTGQCKKIYEPFNKDPMVKWLGPIQNSILPDAFVCDSIGVYNRQGSSNDNCVVEALASGCPVIIPSFGGNADLITNEQEGIIVDSDKWDYGTEYSKRIADAAEKIMLDLGGYKMRSRKHAVKNLSIDVMVKKYMAAMKI